MTTMAWENQPQNWSLNAVYEATRILASTTKAQSFYKLVLLPRVRDYISKNQGLHYLLYKALARALVLPQAFFDGILFPLCKSGTCTMREAIIVGTILEKVFVPPLVSTFALLKLASMEYSATTSYFIKILLEKEHALPDPDPDHVVNALVDHFMKFLTETKKLPVVWHQSLLAFMHRYKNELQNQDKDRLMVLLNCKSMNYLHAKSIERQTTTSCFRLWMKLLRLAYHNMKLKYSYPSVFSFF